MVETDGLENRYAFTGIGGSNPPASAVKALIFNASFDGRVFGAFHKSSQGKNMTVIVES